MKFRVQAKVEGTTVIRTSPLTVIHPPYTLAFEADAGGRVRSLAVERPVADYRQLLPVLNHTSDGHSSLKYPDNPVHEDLIALLQYLESVGSFWCGVYRVAWENADFDWVPESDAEREELVVWNFRVKREYPEPPQEITEKAVHVLLQRRQAHERLTVPLAFYREGQNEFRQFRYVQAFMDFYFMLEGLFGGGGPNYRVKERFKESPSLVAAADAAACELRGSRRHLEGLLQLTRATETCITGNTVLDWLIELRGLVHHYSLKDSRPQAHPNNQREFEVAAFLAMAVCLKLIPWLLTQTALPEDIVQ